MSFDPDLAARLDGILLERPDISRTRMFGGVGYLHHGNMCVGIWRESLILRVGIPAADSLLQQEHVGPMDITRRPMRGWVLVDPGGFPDRRTLQSLVKLALGFVSTLPPKTAPRVSPPGTR